MCVGMWFEESEKRKKEGAEKHTIAVGCRLLIVHSLNLSPQFQYKDAGARGRGGAMDHARTCLEVGWRR